MAEEDAHPNLAKALMAEERFKAALGRTMPQMEVRFKGVSVKADVVVASEDQTKNKLPKLYNTLKKVVVRLSAKKRVVRKQILRNVSKFFKPVQADSFPCVHHESFWQCIFSPLVLDPLALPCSSSMSYLYRTS